MGHGNDARIHIVIEQDPDAAEEALNGLAKAKVLKPATFTAVGGKREIARTILGKLNDMARKPQEIISLPERAPYGRIHINTDGCTLCLACVSACPANALADNPDRPQVRFTEAACVQCGLCKATCPESVITLEARYNFTASAMTPVVLNEQEPFHCVSCGKPFGTKSSVERVIRELQGKHWMFRDEEQANVIRMCNDCRVTAVTNRGEDPFKQGERPRVRTTEDYLKAEEQARATGKSVDDFLT
ncbi:MAG: 4Fe-4S dicluster domain-containing protein, partial [Pseudomonadota bacterium]|nr:4Fe-4S dicluster domain-containing protein [Pseudomonadota bacterium]